mmetsp:Transcript_18652/g.60275  ORF Transcript_18652/g.60275 Transcript_18652/m.60275 type:complete len:195 (-) Transcript_18652:1117-1701(-)
MLRRLRLRVGGARPLGQTGRVPGRPAPSAGARRLFAFDDCLRSSCWRELRAARRVLESAVSAGVYDEVVDRQVDASSSSYVYANGGSQNRDDVTGELDLHPEVLGIEETAAEAHLEHRMHWVPREENQEADDDSKTRDRGNYRLSYDAFARIDALRQARHRSLRRQRQPPAPSVQLAICVARRRGARRLLGLVA